LVDVFGPSVATPAQRRLWGTFERAAASPGLVRSLIEATQSIDVTDVLLAITDGDSERPVLDQDGSLMRASDRLTLRLARHMPRSMRAATRLARRG
jgi:hypothetical protein